MSRLSLNLSESRPPLPLLPLGAKALKLDPALTATPLITTIVDTCSLILLFEIASVMLKGVA